MESKLHRGQVVRLRYVSTEFVALTIYVSPELS